MIKIKNISGSGNIKVHSDYVRSSLLARAKLNSKKPAPQAKGNTIPPMKPKEKPKSLEEAKSQRLLELRIAQSEDQLKRGLYQARRKHEGILAHNQEKYDDPKQIEADKRRMDAWLEQEERKLRKIHDHEVARAKELATN